MHVEIPILIAAAATPALGELKPGPPLPHRAGAGKHWRVQRFAKKL